MQLPQRQAPLLAGINLRSIVYIQSVSDGGEEQSIAGFAAHTDDVLFFFTLPRFHRGNSQQRLTGRTLGS